MCGERSDDRVHGCGTCVITTSRANGRSFADGSRTCLSGARKAACFAPTASDAPRNDSRSPTQNAPPDSHHCSTSLPPHPGGLLALIDTIAADVVVVIHNGLDQYASFSDVTKAVPLNDSVRVNAWPVLPCRPGTWPRPTIPTSSHKNEVNVQDTAAYHSVVTVFGYEPLRELPDPRPAAA